MKASLSFRRSGAFTMVEVIITLTVIGILAALAFHYSGEVGNRVQQTKLDSDVQTLNSAIKIYLASGGSLDGVNDPVEVIRKLKTKRSAESAAKFVGFRGSMLDARMEPVFQTDEEATSDRRRALWNPSKKRFEILTSGAGGISHFSWDSVSGAKDYGEEERDPGVVEYNTENGWIWNYTDAEGNQVVNPTAVDVDPASPLPPTSPPANPNRLLPPQFSVPPGTYDYPEFPPLVEITNPNPEGSSEIFYATVWNTSGIQWMPYTGPIPITTGTQILTYARHSSGDHTDSYTTGGLYVRDLYALHAPQIVTSADYLDLETNGTVTLELIDTNPNFAIQQLEYSINGGGFVPYNGPMALQPSSYAGGFEIVARSMPQDEGFVPSEETIRSLNLKLKVPVIELGEGNSTRQGSQVLVTLTNPNPDGSSELLYALSEPDSLMTTPWFPYTEPIVVREGDYPNGVDVIAYAKSAGSPYLDSDPASELVTTFFGIPVAGSTIFVLDTSGSMSSNNGIRDLRNEMHRVLDNFDATDQFAIIRFSSSAQTLNPWSEASSAALEAGHDSVDGLRARGWTNFSDALSHALAIASANEVAQVIFLSDGHPTRGDTSTAGILSLVHQIVAQGTEVDVLAFGNVNRQAQRLIDQMNAAGEIE